MKKRDKEKEDVFVSSFIQSVILSNKNDDAKTARTVKGHREKLSKEKKKERKRDGRRRGKSCLQCP